MNPAAKKSREATKRNRIWHTAELAAALYQNNQSEDGESDDGSQLTPSMSRQDTQEDTEESIPDIQPTTSRITKRPTD